MSHLQSNLSNPFNINLVIPPLAKANLNGKNETAPFSFLSSKTRILDESKMKSEDEDVTTL